MVLTQIVDQVTQILVPVLAALICALAHKAVKAFSAKTGVAVSAAQEATIDGWIDSGIRYAEEKAHQAAQKGDSKITGHEKLEAAAGFAVDMVKRAGWDTWTRDMLKAKIDAKINVVKERPGSPAGQ
jgi:hypothetical protein